MLGGDIVGVCDAERQYAFGGDFVWGDVDFGDALATEILYLSLPLTRGQLCGRGATAPGVTESAAIVAPVRDVDIG